MKSGLGICMYARLCFWIALISCRSASTRSRTPPSMRTIISAATDPSLYGVPVFPFGIFANIAELSTIPIFMTQEALKIVR
jgi:hypothetical protein